jgi:hypothetical protein
VAGARARWAHGEARSGGGGHGEPRGVMEAEWGGGVGAHVMRHGGVREAWRAGPHGEV